MTFTLIRNATLAGSARLADILIEGERIAAVGPTLGAPDGAMVRDARGLLAFPGLIDVHTHLREPGGEAKEDFTTATRAALAGGVTTVFGMPNTSPAVTDRAALEFALSLAASKALCDFALYLGATAHNATLKRDDPELPECGLKMFMGSSTGDLLVDDFATQHAHFEHYPRERVIAVHAEHEAAVRFFAARGLRRPPICAEIETGRAIALADVTGRRLHICHVSTRREVQLIADAKARGVAVTCEYSPHHLFLAASEPRANALPASCFEMNPPLRARDDVDYLWAHLDVADCIGTDHAPHTLAEKQSAHPPMGMPGLETMLPLLLQAVKDGRMTHADIARLSCDGPARVFGLRGKGSILAGFDADITLVDPRDSWTLGARPIISKCGWTAFAGMPAGGSVHTVFARGRVGFAGGVVLAKPGDGRRVNV